MTKIKNFDFNEINDLTEVLIKNLPSRIKAGNDKESANINELQTIVALKTCKFINFNSKDRISFMVFDIDTMENVTAKEYFKNNIGLYNYIMERIGIAPTYII